MLGGWLSKGPLLAVGLLGVLLYNTFYNRDGDGDDNNRDKGDHNGHDDSEGKQPHGRPLQDGVNSREAPTHSPYGTPAPAPRRPSQKRSAAVPHAPPTRAEEYQAADEQRWLIERQRQIATARAAERLARKHKERQMREELERQQQELERQQQEELDRWWWEEQEQLARWRSEQQEHAALLAASARRKQEIERAAARAAAKREAEALRLARAERNRREREAATAAVSRWRDELRREEVLAQAEAEREASHRAQVAAEVAKRREERAVRGILREPVEQEPRASRPNAHQRNYSDRNDPHYASLRRRARAAGDAMAQAKAFGQVANERGETIAAEVWMNERNRCGGEMTTLDKEASAWIYREKNRNLPVGRVDLHGLYAREACEYAKRAITNAQNHRDFNVELIVGKGNHSQDGISVLRPTIESLVQSLGLRASLLADNTGVLVVHLDDDVAGGAHADVTDGSDDDI